MSNFEETLASVIDLSGLINRSDFAKRLMIATLNDIHRARKWERDIKTYGWSWDEHKAKQDPDNFLGRCQNKNITELTFNVTPDSEVLSITVCDLQGNTKTFTEFDQTDLKDVCVKEPSSQLFGMSLIGPVITLTSLVGFDKMIAKVLITPTYKEANFDSSWIVQQYPNLVIYETTSDIVQDIGGHNVDQWLSKSKHALAHMLATEKHIP